jgi:hypothetical protein
MAQLFAFCEKISQGFANSSRDLLASGDIRERGSMLGRAEGEKRFRSATRNPYAAIHKVA